MDRRILAVLALAAALCIAGIAYLAMTGDSGDYAKILVIRLHVGDGGVTSRSAEIRYGHPPATGLQFGAFRGGLLDDRGNVVREFGVWDPRVQFGDGVAANGSIRGVTVVSREADLLLILPYTGSEEQFVLADTETKTVLADVDLKDAVANFTRVYPADPGGPAASRPEREIPLPVVIGGIVLVVLLIGVLAAMMRKR